MLSRVVSDHGRTFGYIEVGQSTAPIDRIDDLLRLLGIAGLLLTLLIAGASGWFLAGRALGPIDRITRAAEQIGAHDLAQRIAERRTDGKGDDEDRQHDEQRLERAPGNETQWCRKRSHAFGLNPTAQGV